MCLALDGYIWNAFVYFQKRYIDADPKEVLLFEFKQGERWERMFSFNLSFPVLESLAEEAFGHVRRFEIETKKELGESGNF
jgi:hypothetical protein